MRIVRILLVLAVFVAILVGVLQLPVDVPDTNSPLEGNHTGEVNAANTIGQTFVASRNGLDRIEVTLSVEKPIQHSDLIFRLEEVPLRQIREVKRPLASFPLGKVGDFRPGTITQRWYSFEFEPVSDSAGKEYYFSLEGKDLVGPNGVDLLMFFHNGYPLGEAYINGNPVGGHVVFRAYTGGRLSDLIGVLASNATNGMPSFAGAVLTYAALGGVYLILGVTSVLAIQRTR